MKFTSKKDFLMIFLTIISILILWLPVILINDFVGVFYYIVVSLVSLIFVLFLIFTSYEINDKYLVARFLFIKFEVNIDRIKSIRKCKNLYLSFATSYDRFEVSFGLSKNSKWTRFYVSPKFREEFLRLLLERNPEIKIIEYNEKVK